MFKRLKQSGLFLFMLNDAENYCLKIAGLPITNEYTINSILLHGLILNEKNDYFQANLKFNDYIEQSNFFEAKKGNLRKLVYNYYQKENYPKLKSIRKARRLSKILPGAGLFYAGKPVCWRPPPKPVKW